MWRPGLLSAFARRRAVALHRQGEAASDMGDEDRALALYHRALGLDPLSSETLYNIGLIHKYRRCWAESFDYNLRAFEIDSDEEAACWNLGIAATALGDWPMARRAWRQRGYDVGEGEGPIWMDFGQACVRLDPDAAAEVVWVRRRDPVRGELLNVPFPESGHFLGDVVLHDGAATGYKVADDREYPIFNAFERTERSSYGTAAVTIVAPSAPDLQALIQACDAAGMYAENWTDNVQFLCRQCSEGVTHAHHDQDLEDPVWGGERRIGVAVKEEDNLAAVLDGWAAAPGRDVRGLEVSS